MATVLKDEMDENDWFYKGEGAANLVLGYRGSSSSFAGKVLRIQKVPRGKSRSLSKSDILSEHEKLLWSDVEELVKATSKDVATQAYVVQVISPLLGSEYVDGGMLITVSKKFLESIEKNVNSQRPAQRVKAAEVDTLCNSALLISDHSIFSYGILKEYFNIAVELKPKCGFIPSSEFIASKNAVKKHVTRFRMHQFLKHHEGEILHISEYDPLDLFSGEKGRITQAIRALFLTPQNNFRIFINGMLIFGDMEEVAKDNEIKDESSFDAYKKMEEHVKALIQKICCLQLESFVELVMEALFRSRVLDQLLAVQKLDIFDIEGAIHLYYNIISHPCAVCKKLITSEPFHAHALHSFSLEDSLKFVRGYLIAATAKDCSLILSFRPTEAEDSGLNSISLESANQNFDYKAKFIDLDLKPLERMAYYYDLDQKIVDFYANSKVGKGKICSFTADKIGQNQMQR